MKAIGIGLIGFGNINREVMRQASLSGKGRISWILDRSFRNPDLIDHQSGSPSNVAAKEATYASLGYEAKVIHRIEDLGPEDRPDVIIEAASSDVIDCLRYKRQLWGDSVLFVTANKAMVAHHLSEFLGAESVRDVRIEAAVAAGLPLIRSLSEHISADQPQGLVGILNGTTNFMLERMERDPLVTYEHALREAIDKGYAEPGGKGDVDGRDASYKLLILSRIAFGAEAKVEEAFEQGLVRGIDDDEDCQRLDRVRPIDFAYAHRYLNSTIRLVSVAKPSDDGSGLLFLVFPMLVPAGTGIAQVNGPDNYVEVYSNYTRYKHKLIIFM